MKRLPLALIALGAVVAPVSCTKQDANPSPEYVTITLSLDAGDSGRFPTKGISEEIAATLPEQMTITLTNKASGEAFECTTGMACRIPVGTYTAFGRTAPEVRQEIYGTTHYTSAAPLVVVEQDLDVTEGKTSYSVTAEYRCFALVANRSDVAGWQVKSNGEWTALEKSTTSEIWWTFVVGDYDAEHPLRTMVILPDNSGLDYTFYTSNLQEGGLLAEWGKWYLLRPGSSTMQTGSLGLVLPEWTAGN